MPKLSYNFVYKDLGLMDYKEAWDYQVSIFDRLVGNKKQDQNRNKQAADEPGTLIFVEHPHVYTLGKNGSENNLLINMIQMKEKSVSFYRIDRGGDITYHGPGQIVGYPIFDLEKIRISLKQYIHLLEEAIIVTLAKYMISASRLEGGTGVWIEPGIKNRARKICAIGVKASRYVTMHGFAFNVNTDLIYFNDINPCGFTDKGVTSMEKELGMKQDIAAVKKEVLKSLQEVFDLKLINQ